jgi:hypothetical protein
MSVSVVGTDLKDRKGEQGRPRQQERVAGVDGISARVTARRAELGPRVPEQRREWGRLPREK